MKRKLAYGISRIFGPFPLFCILNLVLGLRVGIPIAKAVWLYPLLAIVGLVIPFGILTWLQIRHTVSDLDWSNIKERKIAVVVLSFFWVINIIIIRQIVGSTSTLYHITQLFLLITFLIFACLVVFRFKISNHAAAASIVFWGINFMTHFQFWWLFIFLIPIAWSRYVLRIHTWQEIFLGLVLSNGLIVLAVLIFGLPTVP